MTWASSLPHSVAPKIIEKTAENFFPHILCYSKSSLNVFNKFLETVTLREAMYNKPILPQAHW